MDAVKLAREVLELGLKETAQHTGAHIELLKSCMKQALHLLPATISNNTSATATELIEFQIGDYVNVLREDAGCKDPAIVVMKGRNRSGDMRYAVESILLGVPDLFAVCSRQMLEKTPPRGEVVYRGR